MAKIQDSGLLLGRQTPLVDAYSPQLLYPIPRSEGRARLGLREGIPFFGVDLWHAYELSWLDATAKPVMRVGRFTIPADSPNMVESKSFKLYLNSLNNVSFENEQSLVSTITRDIAAVAGAPVELQLYQPDDTRLAGGQLGGVCLDELPMAEQAAGPDPDVLRLIGESREEQFYTHLLRSLCPVTGQPDWASVHIKYRGPGVEPASLLSYIAAYRRHQEFHEQCVERMFLDLQQRCQPQFLQVQAFYTRRGGLDINPMRSSESGGVPLPRLDRQ